MCKAVTQGFQLLFILSSFSTLGGCISYEGHSFILAFSPVGMTMIGQLYIMNARLTTTCTVTTDNITTEITVKGNEQTTFDLPAYKGRRNGTYMEKGGIRVDCKDKVQMYSFFARVEGYESGVSPVIPIQSLSTDYVVPFSGGPAVTVLAMSDHTLVSVNVSTCAITYKGRKYTNGDIMSVYLDSSEVFRTEPLSRDCTLHIFGSDRIAVYYCPSKNFAAVAVPPASHEISSIYISTYIRIIPVLTSAMFDFNNGYNRHMYNSTFVSSSVSYMLKETLGVGTFVFVTLTTVPAVSDYWHDYWIPNVQSHNVTYTRYITVVTQSRCITKFKFLVDSNWTHVTVDSDEYSITSVPVPADLNRIRTTPDCKFAVEVYGIRSDFDAYGFFVVPTLQDLTHQGLTTVARTSTKHTPSSAPSPSSAATPSPAPTPTSPDTPSSVPNPSSAATTSPEDLKTSFNLTCETDGWYIELEPKTFLSKFPNSHLSNIYLSNAFCSGISDGDIIAFNYSYQDCNTFAQENNTSKTYSNYLVEYGQDPITNLSTQVLWRYDIQCIRPRREIDFIAFVPIDNTTGIHIQSTSKIKDHQAVIEFYTDSSFSSPLTGNPLKVTTGSRVYVQVETKVTDGVKLLVDSCFVSPAKEKNNSTLMIPLILNRCVDNHSVHIIGTVDKLTRFYFDVFEIPHHHNNIYVTCDVSFCDLMDFTQECQHGCQRSIP